MTTNLAANAARVVRKSWADNIDGFAQEVYSVLAADAETETGPIAVAVAATGTPNLFYEVPSQPTLNIPIVDLDSPTPDSVVGTEYIEGEDTRGGESDRKVTRTRQWWQRSVSIGKIVSFQSGDSTYTVDIYPNGTDADPITLTGVVPKHPGGAGSQVPANYWVYVMRSQLATVTGREFKNDTGEQVSQTQRITVTTHRAEFINQDVLHDDVIMPGDLTIQDNNQLFFRNGNTHIRSISDGNLDLSATDGVNLGISGSTQVRVTNDNMTFITGGTNCILNFTSSGVLNMTTGRLYISTASTPALEVDGPVQFDGAMDINAAIDVSTTSDLHGAVKCYSSLEVDATAQLDGALDHNGTTVGFFSKTPATQASDYGGITDSSAGTADGTISDVSGVGNVDPTVVKNNFAECATQFNAIRAVLQRHGLMA